jgi:hypothetical protein
MAASAICCALSALACVALLRRAIAPSRIRTLACVAVAVLAASLAQHEALLWGLEFSLVLPGTLAVLGVFAIPRVSAHLRLRLALLVSLLGLLSFAAGVALFAALGFAAWRAGTTRRAALVFVLASIVVIGAWHADLQYASTGARADAQAAANAGAAAPAGLERVWRIPAHFLAALGSGTTAAVLWPLARKGGGTLEPLIDAAAVCAGLLPLAVFGFELFRRRKPEAAHEQLTAAAWALFLFGLCNAALIAVGRHDQGISQALSSRYVTLTVLAPVGAVLLLARDGRRWALGLFAAAALANAAAGLAVAHAWREARLEGAASVPFARELPELPGF